MIGGASHVSAEVFLGTLAMTQPRILAVFALLPLFSRQAMPGLLRFVLGAAIGLVLVPALAPTYQEAQPGAVGLALLLVKELFIGVALGFLFAIPFWAIEAVGSLIDNQRGASMGAILNPATGNDASPLGILLHQAFIVFFLVSGGLTLMLGVLYDSFVLWDVWHWTPTLDPAHAPLLLDQLGRLMRFALLLAAPAMIAMLLAELGLALVNRFVPQLQVFFLALPIKSALALLVLVLYAGTLFEYAGDMINALRETTGTLDAQWRAPGAAP